MRVHAITLNVRFEDRTRPIAYKEPRSNRDFKRAPPARNFSWAHNKTAVSQPEVCGRYRRTKADAASYTRVIRIITVQLYLRPCARAQNLTKLTRDESSRESLEVLVAYTPHLFKFTDKIFDHKRIENCCRTPALEKKTQ